MSDLETEVEGIRNRLVSARKFAGLSQGQVAKLLGFSGTAATVSQWEHGGRGLDIYRLLQLRDLYGVSIEWLMTGVNPHYSSLDIMSATRNQEVINQLKAILEPLVRSK